MTEATGRQEIPGRGRFHHEGIRDNQVIRSLLKRLREEGVELRLRVNRSMRLETARIVMIRGETLSLKVKNYEADDRENVVVNFYLDGLPYFFAAARLGAEGPNRLNLAVPGCVYRSERRERIRRGPSAVSPAPRRIVIEGEDRELGHGNVADYSAVGLGVEVEEATVQALTDRVRVRFLDGPWAGERRLAEVRHRSPSDGGGWIRLGLAVSEVARRGDLSVESRQRILQNGPIARLRRDAAFLRAGIRLASTRTLGRLGGGRREELPSPWIVEYKNEKGEPLRAIVNSTGSTKGALAIVIPPAWGRTKETLSPLASVLIETYRRARVPAVVLRFDGIRRRGESHNDPDCMEPGREQLRYSLSQGVSDIMATLDFLQHSGTFETRRAILVTFSAAALDGRKAVARDQGRRVRGWVSVVGMPELQHCMRVISGGVDYPVAIERGMHLGVEEILGVPIDVDLIVGDAVRNGFAYLEDARRDMAEIDVPITWIHGRYDAWMEIDRVREILACGNPSERRLLEVPTGHQLSTSREALEVFQLIAEETGRMALSRPLKPAVPPLAELERVQRGERARLSRRRLDLRSFWRDFLLGRDRKIGVDWLGATHTYQTLMLQQIEALELRRGDRVADLGAGTGPFPWQLALGGGGPARVVVDEVDFVKEGLERARARLRPVAGSGADIRVRYVTCNLDSERTELPFRDASYDAVLGSLLLSYVARPEKLLVAVRRVLRPGGQLVLSTLKRDADLSKLYVDAIEELRGGRAREVFGEDAEELVIRSAPKFLNEASRLLDYEEEGAFHFWNRQELVQLVRRAGFRQIRSRFVLGDPPQAILVVARRS